MQCDAHIAIGSDILGFTRQTGFIWAVTYEIYDHKCHESLQFSSFCGTSTFFRSSTTLNISLYFSATFRIFLYPNFGASVPQNFAIFLKGKLARSVMISREPLSTSTTTKKTRNSRSRSLQWSVGIFEQHSVQRQPACQCIKCDIVSCCANDIRPHLRYFLNPHLTSRLDSSVVARGSPLLQLSNENEDFLGEMLSFSCVNDILIIQYSLQKK